jgi:sec-independent protein translocase protein TatA
MPGFIGVPELLLLGLVALLLFGPKRLPEMGRGLGKGMREFKDSVTGITDMSPAPAAVESTTVESKQIEPAPRTGPEL